MPQHDGYPGQGDESVRDLFSVAKLRLNPASRVALACDVTPKINRSSNHDMRGVRSEWDMQTDPEESDSRVTQRRMLEQIVAIPAILFFPTRIVDQLNEICESLGYTPEQLIIEALKGQIDYWNEFYEHVMTLPIDPEDFVWPKDPMFCLACVTTVHIIDSYTRCSRDPGAFAQLKNHAPREWAFSSLGGDQEIEDADWWKTHS